MDPTLSSSLAKAFCCSISRLMAVFFCSSVSPSRLISARCLGRLEVVSGCDVGDVLVSKMELSHSGLLTFSFNFTSTGVTDCANFSRASGVLLSKMISWLVVLIASVLILLDFPGFSDKRVHCTIRPEGHGSNWSGSNGTGVLLSIGPWFTRHEIATLVPFGKTASFLSDLTEKSSVSLCDKSLMIGLALIQNRKP